MDKEIVIDGATYIARKNGTECPRCGSKMGYSNMEDKTVYRQCYTCKMIEIVKNVEIPAYYYPALDYWTYEKKFNVGKKEVSAK